MTWRSVVLQRRLHGCMFDIVWSLGKEIKAESGRDAIVGVMVKATDDVVH